MARAAKLSIRIIILSKNSPARAFLLWRALSEAAINVHLDCQAVNTLQRELWVSVEITSPAQHSKVSVSRLANCGNTRGWALKVGDKCGRGSQLRSHIVWFGEAVPDMQLAKRFAKQANFLWLSELLWWSTLPAT